MRGCSRKGGTVSRASPASMARSVLAFGPLARQEADEQGDIGFLVEMEPGLSLLDPGWLHHELEQLPGRHADVVTARGLKPRIRKRVLREAPPAARRPGQIPSSGQPRSHFRALFPHSGGTVALPHKAPKNGHHRRAM